MWHTTCTQGIQGDSQLLVVESQIVNSTPDLSFADNFCFNHPNGSCEPILEIYILRVSNDIRNFTIQWVLPLQSLSEKLGIHRDSNSQSASSLGNVEVHSLTLSHTPGSMECDSQASLLARTFVSLAFVASPRLGL
jgi:hypothetical protein